jgi:RNA-directed DNA polymerase
LKEVSKINVKSYASSVKVSCWQDINFRQAKNRVKKLQLRIAKAYQDGAFGKVVSLQHTLIHSLYARALAVKTVTSNKGKNTSGIDGVLWISPEDKWQATLTLKRRGYKPLPLRRIYIHKSNGKMRPLSIPSMRDRAMQTLYRFALEPIAEYTADVNSYGFMNGKCSQDAIRRCVDVLSNNNSHEWILEADIYSCFDNIAHHWIMTNIPIDKIILRKFLKSGFIENNKWNPTEKGTPQGGCISTTICNMTLDGLENTLKELHGYDVYFIRYADDFIITCADKEFLEQKIVPTINKFLSKRGLRLSAEKTTTTHIDDGFNFLGWNVQKSNAQILVTPSTKNLCSLMSKINNIIKQTSHNSLEQQFSHLRPVIIGWLNFHKNVVTESSLKQAEENILSFIRACTKSSCLAERIKPLFGTS